MSIKNNRINRREWIKATGAVALGTMLNRAVFGATLKSKPRILLVSGWQDVNIDDIAQMFTGEYVSAQFIGTAYDRVRTPLNIEME